MSATLNNPVLAEIAMMIPEGNTLQLPQTKLTEYPKVKKLLQQAGGVYKRCAFHFSKPGADVQAALCGGETLNDKKKYQFFATPTELALKAVQAASIEPHHSWLEPSAGQGAISDLMRDISSKGTVVELMEENADILERKGYSVLKIDFMNFAGGMYSRIVANPPFTKGQDIAHIRKMYEHLEEGGILVSFASTSWVNGSVKAQQEFRDWLGGLNHKVESIPAGVFKDSGTNIPTVMITILK